MGDMSGEGQEGNNLEVIQRYTESVHKTIADSISALDTKLTTVIGFSGVLIRFTNDLSICNNWFVAVKITVCLLLIASVIFSAIGLAPRSSGAIVTPRELREDFYYGKNEECRRYITDNLITAIEQMEKFRSRKRHWLFYGILFLTIGTVIFGLDIAIGSGFESCSALQLALGKVIHSLVK
jgi:hypothetical protein